MNLGCYFLCNTWLYTSKIIESYQTLSLDKIRSLTILLMKESIFLFTNSFRWKDFRNIP